MTDDIWTQSTLGDLAERWVVGSTPPRTHPEYFIQDGGTPWVKAEDVKGGILCQTGEQLSEAGGRQMQLIGKDAVLVTTAGTICKTAMAGRPVFCNQAVQALTFRKDTVLPQYVCYFLRSQRPLLLQLAGATVIPNISKAKLQSVLIRFPPVPVQERMAAQMCIPETLCERAESLQGFLKKYLLALTVREAGRTKRYVPLGELLAEPPLTGLRAKASSTGNGVPLVNKLNKSGSMLTNLEDCLRVQVPEKQFSRYRLRPMDILLRNTAPGGGTRSALVGEFSEEALAGGNLTRLRLRSPAFSAWLLAWLQGPGGETLYVGGKLQKQMLRQYRVPVPQHPKDLERRIWLYLALEEKTARFAERAQALFESTLRIVFGESTVEPALGKQSRERLDARLAKLTEPMSQFVRELSGFQRELYHLLLQSEDGQPVHTLLKQLRRGELRQERAAGIQDALATFSLLEQFGFVEQESARKIPLLSAGMKADDAPQAYVTDHNGQPVLIDTYKPTEDIFEEIAYAIGAGQDTEL